MSCPVYWNAVAAVGICGSSSHSRNRRQSRSMLFTSSWIPLMPLVGCHMCSRCTLTALNWAMR
jgi:hypothetical protein